MNETVKRDWGLVVTGVAMIIIGFAFLLVPGITLIAVAVIAGGALLASGVVDVISYVRFRRPLDLSGWMLAAAVLDIILGAVILLHPLVSAVVVPWLAAIAFAVYGVLELVAAWRMASASPRVRPGASGPAGVGGGRYTSSPYPGNVTLPSYAAPAGSWGWSLFGGVVAIVCAIAFVLAPESFALFLAFFIMIRGIIEIAHGMSMGRAASQGYVA